MPVRLLIVEDDDAIAAPLLRAIGREGYDVHRVATGGEALDEVARDGFELVLLDLGLPDMDGLDVCRALRADGFGGAIMILTARAGELDRVVGLDIGADDYLAKPFSLSELLARVRALLRRTLPAPAAGPTAPAVPAAAPPAPPAAPPARNGLRVERDARRAWVAGTELPLTAKEFDVLALLDERRGAVVAREALMAQVWDENWFGSTKTLDATVGRLRQKLQDHGAPLVLGTVRGVGFRLEDAADHA